MTTPAILVTGGAGFLGSAFVRSWISESRGTVVNLDKLTYAGNLDSLLPVSDDQRHVFVEGDIADGPLVSQLLEEYQPQGIIHFAAESYVDRSIDSPATFVETNVLGTWQLLEATIAYWTQLEKSARDKFRFLHVSTDEVHSSLGATGCFKEQSQYAPNSPYAASNAAADHLVRAAHLTFGLPTLLTNCSKNYGPYQFPEKLIPLIIMNCLEAKPLPVYGDGAQVRDWLFVEDHYAAIREILARGCPGSVFHVGGNAERTNLVVVLERICDVADRLHPDASQQECRSLITHVKDRPGHDRRCVIDASKIRKELGWKPTVDLETGMRRMVQWYLDNPTCVSRVAQGTYHRKRFELGSGMLTGGKE